MDSLGPVQMEGSVLADGVGPVRLLQVLKSSASQLNPPAFYHGDGDGNSVASCGSEVLSRYGTLDAPPHHDFYTNTEVWGRRRRFRPSLYELYTNPEVLISLLIVLVPLVLQ